MIIMDRDMDINLTREGIRGALAKKESPRAKIEVIDNIDPDTGKKWHHTQYKYECKGCGYYHVFALKKDGGHHDFNMDLYNPTVSPSLVQGTDSKRICHSFIKDGKIQYLNDCWHEMKGMTVELSDITPSKG